MARSYRRALKQKQAQVIRSRAALPVDRTASPRTSMQGSFYEANIQGMGRARSQMQRPMKPRPEVQFFAYKKGDIPKHERGFSFKPLIEAGIVTFCEKTRKPVFVTRSKVV